MAHKITLVQACEGLLRTKTAAGLSPHTIADYKNTFKKLFLFFDDEIPLQDISRKDIVDFFAWLQEDYISNPDGVAPRRKKPLSPKSIRNIHTNLSAFWVWAIEEDFVQKNVVKGVDKPSASPPVIEPYTKDDVVALLRACELCGISIEDANLDANNIKIRGKRPCRDPMERLVYFGRRTGQH
jgi:site-specific recombinase XerD